MKILQIHLDKLHEARKYCVSTVREKYDCEYIWIDGNNYKKYIDEMIAYYEVKVPIKKHIDKIDINELNGRVLISEWLRWFFLGTRKNLLYIDTDVECLEPFYGFVNDDIPYLGCDKNGKYSTWCIYNNNAFNIFDNWVYDYINRGCRGFLYFNFIRIMKFNKIPPIHFTHYGSLSHYGKQTEIHWWHNQCCDTAKNRYEREMNVLKEKKLYICPYT